MLARSVVAGAIAATSVAAAKVCAAQAVIEGGVDGSWVAALPEVSLGDLDATSVRTFHGGSLPSAGRALLVGGHVGASAQVNRRWAIPMLSMGLSGAIGPSERTGAAADGTLVQLKPWTAWQLMFLGPGVETRATFGKWLLSGSVRGGITMLWMGVDVAAGGAAENHTAHALSGVVRAEARGCRRLDPTHRLCLSVAPHIYQYGWMNGVTAGLLWELGP